MKNTGQLIVITGLSGSGKDTVIDNLLKRFPEFRRLITCTDRLPRDGEIHGVHYFFVKPKILDLMHKSKELVEVPLKYGTSRKATPKSEFHKVIYDGHKVIWRIDTSLAAKVATHCFFDEQFTKYESRILKTISEVIFITSPKNTLHQRRKARDKESYDPNDYKQRDNQDKSVLVQYKSVFSHVIVNENGKLKQTVDTITEIIGAET
ncbi:MAG: Guanylate kinase [Candidatus Woesebacteria bacterium GW2011_GWA1_37_8]|uniref:Guanylate kinase n=2 Tax=Candidatus Woeseibacteriota TaxID=1752722 RepID=A0A0G0L624_9BACT|nr:MAG: hypothetical protein US39_C0008G0029 [Microgenomates group bacterium GW2011_GWC1_37_12b]KKQ43722.1 MAG: Guanylate kinase [Candidatus Woesebacteria bacterium GW2011_GWA1_37_8]KKQ86477.1 MAG: Guanylate kinase [Candidatus Woesebacteria bacterium GW2011_GWB1_38_8b]